MAPDRVLIVPSEMHRAATALDRGIADAAGIAAAVAAVGATPGISPALQGRVTSTAGSVGGGMAMLALELYQESRFLRARAALALIADGLGRFADTGWAKLIGATGIARDVVGGQVGKKFAEFEKRLENARIRANWRNLALHEDKAKIAVRRREALAALEKLRRAAAGTKNPFLGILRNARFVLAVMGAIPERFGDTARRVKIDRDIVKAKKRAGRLGRIGKILGNRWLRGGVRGVGRLLGPVGAVLTYVDRVDKSSVQSRLGRHDSAALAALVNLHPYVGAVDLVTDGGVSALVDAGMVAREAKHRFEVGDPRWADGLKELHRRNLDGDNGWVFKGASVSGEAVYDLPANARRKYAEAQVAAREAIEAAKRIEEEHRDDPLDDVRDRIPDLPDIPRPDFDMPDIPRPELDMPHIPRPSLGMPDMPKINVKVPRFGLGL